MTEWMLSESGCGQQHGQDRGDQRSKDQNKIFNSNQHLSQLLHCITTALFITWSALLQPQAVTMERNTKHIKVRCWQQLRLGSLGVSVSVGMFSSVLLLVREYQWSRQSLPVISIGLLEQQDFWGTDGSLATQWTWQLFIHGYWHPICFKFLPTAPLLISRNFYSVQHRPWAEYPADCEYCGQIAKPLLELSWETWPEVK